MDVDRNASRLIEKELRCKFALRVTAKGDCCIQFRFFRVNTTVSVGSYEHRQRRSVMQRRAGACRKLQDVRNADNIRCLLYTSDAADE